MIMGSMTKEQRLAIVLLLNVGMVIALVVVGFTAHSLGVLAAGVDYVGDAAGGAISLRGCCGKSSPTYAEPVGLLEPVRSRSGRGPPGPSAGRACAAS